jgi:hypothetical protein
MMRTMMLMRRLFAFALLFTLGCGTSSGERPADIPRPDISVQQAGSIFFGSSTSAPVSIDVRVTNTATVPITVREVEISSPGMMQYSINRATKTFNETIPPGETRTVGLTATAVSRQARTTTQEPLSVRAIVRLEANGRGFREIVMQQFAGPGV